MLHPLMLSAILAVAVQVSPKAAEVAFRDTLIVLNKAESTVNLIDPTTGETRATLDVGTGPHEVAVSPDGRTAVVADYGQRSPGRTLSVIDVADGRVVKTIDLREYHRPHGIVFLDDGRRVLVTAESERRLLLVDVAAGEVVSAFETDQEVSHMVALTPDQRHAYVANIRSGSVSIVDLEEGNLTKILPTGAGAEGVAAHPTRDEVWVSNRAADTISIIDTNTQGVIETIECATFPIRVLITPDGRHALVSNLRSADVAVFDVEQRREIARIKMEIEAVADEEQEGRLFGRTLGRNPAPIGLITDPEGRFAYVANTNADVVAVIDTSDWTVVARFPTGREPDGLGWSRIVKEPGAADEEAGG